MQFLVLVAIIFVSGYKIVIVLDPLESPSTILGYSFLAVKSWKMPFLLVSSTGIHIFDVLHNLQRFLRDPYNNEHFGFVRYSY